MLPKTVKLSCYCDSFGVNFCFRLEKGFKRSLPFYIHGISVGRNLEPVKQKNLFSVSFLREVPILLVFNFLLELSKFLYLLHWELASNGEDFRNFDESS